SFSAHEERGGGPGGPRSDAGPQWLPLGRLASRNAPTGLWRPTVPLRRPVRVDGRTVQEAEGPDRDCPAGPALHPVEHRTSALVPQHRTNNGQPFVSNGRP